jgi:phosphohistidine phosphatase SixA
VHEGNTKSVEEARAVAASAKATGYDLIKSHHLTDVAVWQALQDEARKHGIATAGHVTNQVGILRAAAAGQQIEHLDGFFYELLPANAPERNIPFGQLLPPPVLQAVAKMDDAAFDALARKLAAAKSHHVPTLSLFEKIGALDVPIEQVLASPALRFATEAQIEQWTKQRTELVTGGVTAADGKLLTEVRRRAVRALNRAGVPIMPGSDTPQRFHVWGPALLEEIENLAAAGLTPMEALRSATVVPRNYFRSLPGNGSSLGWKAEFGTIEPGARADIILLAQDPSKSVSALRSLQTVIAAGRVYDRPALDAMLDKAAADAKAAKPTPPPAAAAAATLSFPPSIYVLRHLEKGAGDDPSLSEAGAANAKRLVAMLDKDPPVAIFATATRRAQETAAPLAAKLGIPVTTYADAEGLLTAVAAQKGTVLIVGHSNTVPDIVERLGGARPAALTDSDYGDIWHVAGPARTVTKRKLGQN